MRTNSAQVARAAVALTGVIFLLLACAAPAGALQASATGQTPVAATTPQAGGEGSNKLLARLTGPPSAHAIADVDEAVPPVDPKAPCSLPEVLQPASNRIRELVTNLQQFAAIERIEHREANKNGDWRAPEIVTFNYVAELQEIRAGMLHMEETRNGSTSSDLFPAKLADVGLPGIALIFHPYFVDEYSMSCEGLGQWEGRPAWQVHFQQRPDRPARLRVYTIQSRSYPVKLKGRAWIATDGYQMLHIETDLLEPVPQIRLIREHLAIDYEPVRFQKQNVELWLPDTADVYMNFRGRVYHRRHSFSNFLLFSVDVDQKIAEPTQPGQK